MVFIVIWLHEQLTKYTVYRFENLHKERLISHKF